MVSRPDLACAHGVFQPTNGDVSVYRTSFFLIGFYTLSLVCFVLILKYGVLDAINPPSRTLRGLFVLACTVAGFAGGAISIFFWKATRYCIGAWGGFAFALFIQCLRNGGLIHPISYRWIMYIGAPTSIFSRCPSDQMASFYRMYCYRLHALHHTEDTLPHHPDFHRFCRRDVAHAGGGLLFRNESQRGTQTACDRLSVVWS